MIPIRCISCGKPVSAYFDEYNRRLADGEDSKEILDLDAHIYYNHMVFSILHYVDCV